MLAIDSSCFKDQSIVTDFTCVLCMTVFFKPMLDPCGHTYCQGCVLSLAKDDQITCPCSRSVFKAEQLRANTCVERIIGGFELRCIHFEAGCEWRGYYKNFEKHLFGDCVNKLFNCPNVGCLAQNFDKVEYQEHSLKCEYFTFACEHCHVFLTRKELKKHTSVDCQEIKVSCKFCKTQMARKMIKAHEKVCNDALFACPFYEHGCWTEAKMREFYPEYYQDIKTTTDHLFHIKSEVSRTRNRFIEFLEAVIKNCPWKLEAIKTSLTYYFFYGSMDDPVGRRQAMIAMSY